jgi:hypothetical protein
MKGHGWLPTVKNSGYLASLLVKLFGVLLVLTNIRFTITHHPIKSKETEDDVLVSLTARDEYP